MRKGFVVLLSFFVLGCAKVNLQTEKPLKVNINMRVDVYQHVVKDVEAIEGQIYNQNKKINLNGCFFLESVYAQEFSSSVEKAIQRRKKRLSDIEEYAKQGVIGEGKNALLVVVAKKINSSLKKKVEELISEENKDRLVIYKATAAKNGVSLKNVEKIFFAAHYNHAQPGMWFEVFDSKTNSYNWVKK